MVNRCWTEINLGTIVQNLNIYRASAHEGMEIMAAVKADAYGHGDVEVSRVLARAGVSRFAVATVQEAIGLREAGITGEILILGYTDPRDADLLIRYDVVQAIISEEHAEAFCGKRIRAQVAIDSGMNRIGLDADDPERCAEVIRRCAKEMSVEGIFTHLCVADDVGETDFTNGQIWKFRAVADLVADLHLPYIHCLNSAGGLWVEPFGNLIRLGIILYGLTPGGTHPLPKGIKPALQWKATVSMVKTVRKGETIGYGRTFTAERDLRVATVTVGYADGYNRRLSNRGVVMIRGQRAPVVGRVCMDQITVDVTKIPDVCAGDVVTLIGDGYTTEDMARDIGTIGHEVVCGISPRVNRIYIEREEQPN